jgi:uncharacterized surface anchored protein
MNYALERESVLGAVIVVGLSVVAFLGVLAFLSGTAHAATGFGSVEVTEVVKGGTANPGNFTITIKKVGSSSSGSVTASGGVITFESLTPGTYALTQTGGPSGYTASWSGNCNAQGQVTVAAGTVATCTITDTFGGSRGGGSGSGSGGSSGGSTRSDRPVIVRPTR